MDHSVDNARLIAASFAKTTTSDRHVHINARPMRNRDPPSSSSHRNRNVSVTAIDAPISRNSKKCKALFGSDTTANTRRATRVSPRVGVEPATAEGVPTTPSIAAALSSENSPASEPSS